MGSRISSYKPPTNLKSPAELPIRRQSRSQQGASRQCQLRAATGQKNGD